MSDENGQTPDLCVYNYTDAQAIADGFLIAIAGEGGVNRVTRSVYDAFTSAMGDPRAGIVDVTELVAAVRSMLRLRPSEGWRIGFHKGKMLWLIPNEVEGLTLMFPEDY